METTATKKKKPGKPHWKDGPLVRFQGTRMNLTKIDVALHCFVCLFCLFFLDGVGGGTAKLWHGARIGWSISTSSDALHRIVCFVWFFFRVRKRKKKEPTKQTATPGRKKNECETVAPQFPEEEEEEEDDDDEEEEEDGEAKTTHHTNNQYSFL